MRGDARHDDYGPRAYASIPERITWTKGFTAHVDKHVLGSLATFANFKTGIRANMRLELLSERSGVPRRTLLRSLKRLETEGWVSAQHRHRHPTSYDINVDRLAATWLTARRPEEADETDLSATDDTQEADLSATTDTQTGDFHTSLSATDGTQIRVWVPSVALNGVNNGTQISYKEALKHREVKDLLASSKERSPCIDPQYKTDPQVIRATRGDSQTTTTATTGDDASARLSVEPITTSPPDPNWPQRLAATLRESLKPPPQPRVRHA